MMSRHLSDKQLLAVLYGSELLKPERRQHLHSCPSCRQSYALLREMELQLQQLPQDAVPEQFADKVMQSLHSFQPSFPKAGSFTRFKKYNEFIHGLIAAAATYFFVASGMLNKLILLETNGVGEGIHTKVAFVLLFGTSWIHSAAETVMQWFS